MRLSAIRSKAVAFGLLTDILGSIFIGLALSIILVLYSGDPTGNRLRELSANTMVKLIGLAGTLFFTALGGYVAARMSDPYGAENSLAVGLLSLSLGIMLAISVPGVTPQWKIVLGCILTVPAAMLGGRLAKRPG